MFASHYYVLGAYVYPENSDALVALINEATSFALDGMYSKRDRVKNKKLWDPVVLFVRVEFKVLANTRD